MRGTRDGADRAVGSAWALRYCTAAVDVALALARWLIGAGVLVKIPQMVGRSAGIPPAFFSARKESRWSRKETLRGAVVGNASSGTARFARGSGGLPFYVWSDLYERRKCAAVVRGAGDGDWWVSWCGAVCGSAWLVLLRTAIIVLVQNPPHFFPSCRKETRWSRKERGAWSRGYRPLTTPVDGTFGKGRFCGRKRTGWVPENRCEVGYNASD